MRTIEVPVLVVGAGPVGLAAAMLLAQQGLRCLVVERRDGPHRAPQAHVVNPRTLEICRAMGVDMEAIRAQATPAEDGGWVRWVTTLTGAELGSLPYERQDEAVLEHTPTPLVNLSQHLFEPILAARLRDEPWAAVRYLHQWESAERDGEGVLSVVQDLATGDRHRVRARYVLACDGAASRVRRALGIEMLGPERIQSFVMIHFEAALRPCVKDRPAILYWVLDPAGLGAFVAHDIDRTWVFMHPYDPDSESIGEFSAERCAGIVRRAIGHEDVALEVKTIGAWTMTAQVAERYREGPTFLVGDAAHRFPPSGGLGLNTGIQDVHNLVWKIRAVEDGRAGVELLESYEAERRPVALQNAEQSLMNAMKLLEVVDAAGLSGDDSLDRARVLELSSDGEAHDRLGASIDGQRDHFDMLALQLGFSYDEGAVVPDGSPKPVGVSPVRDFIPTTRPGSRLPHAWLEHGKGRISTLDLLAYDRFTLITGERGEAWLDAAARVSAAPIQVVRVGVDAHDPTGAWQRVSGIEADGAILVRPDGHVAWRSPSLVADPAATLHEVLSKLLGRASA